MSRTVFIGSERSSKAGVEGGRRFYNGGIASEDVPPNEPASRGEKYVRTPSSTFNTILILFFAAVAIVVYISNIIAVNRLAVEVNELRQKYETIANGNEILRAEVNRQSSLDRIGKIAIEQLGLRYSKQQPQFLEVDERSIRDE